MIDLRHAVIKEHARLQMAKRQIAEADVRDVLNRPEAVISVRPGRVVAHSVIDGYLIRVFVDIDREPSEVVTAYRTSKIEKYRS